MNRNSTRLPGRSYGIGERNPNTMWNSAHDAESYETHVERTRFWKSLGKVVRSANSSGWKY